MLKHTFPTVLSNFISNNLEKRREEDLWREIFYRIPNVVSIFIHCQIGIEK